MWGKTRRCQDECAQSPGGRKAFAESRDANKPLPGNSLTGAWTLRDNDGAIDPGMLDIFTALRQSC